MLVLTIAGETLFWGVAPLLGYPGLLVAALLGGLLSIPVFLDRPAVPGRASAGRGA